MTDPGPLPKHPWLAQLRDYQQTGALWLQDPPSRGRLLPWAPGLGKTASAIAAVRIRHDNGKLDSTVPVITTAIARSDWARELRRWWPEAQCHIMRVDDVEAHHHWETDEQFTSRRQMTWRKALGLKLARPTFLITSYESARDLHEVACEDNLLFDTVVWDECHNFKKARNLTSVLLRVLVAKARLNVLLTGTPIHNRPTDLFNLLSVMDPQQFPSFHTWAKRFFMLRVSHGNFGTTVDELLDKSGLHEACSNYMLDVPIEQALGDLPALQRKLVRIPVKEAVRISPAKMNGMRSGSGLDLALRAMVSHKLKYIEQLVLDMDEPIVVYTYRREDASKLFEQLMKKGVKCTLATGDSTTDRRARDIEMWKAGATRILVATMGALKESATLTRASLMVFADLDWLPGVMAQLEGRISSTRQPEGERRPARFVYVTVEGGCDEVVAERVIQKIEEMQGVVTMSQNVEGLKSLLHPMKARKTEVSPTEMLQDLVERLELRSSRMSELGLDEGMAWAE